MTDERTSVLEHSDWGNGYRLLVLRAPKIAARVTPGQFVHVRVPRLETSALRRPFSVFDAEEDRLSLLYKTVGRGTQALNGVNVGETLDVLGPLGKGFPVVDATGIPRAKRAAQAVATGVRVPPVAEHRSLLVGGGYGVAPLHFLARRLAGRGDVALFAGGRTKDDLLALDRFERLGVAVHPATNDGSAGARGLVTVPLDEELAALRKRGAAFSLFACGPDPMLKAIAERAVSMGAPGWISMDRHMVCGVGACYACIQETVKGNARCCVDGPVFSAAELVWH